MSIVHFDEPTHTYTVGGQRKPSVTQILKPLIDFSMIDPGILEAKSDLGRRAHRATELDDLGELDEASVAEDVAPRLKAWRQFKADIKPAIILVEHRVFNKEANYCGTLDRVLGIDADDWLIDIKCSAEIHRAVGPQTAAYEAGLYASRKLRRGVVQLRPDGTYRFRELTSPRDWVTFQACNLIHRFNEENPYV